MKREDEEKKRQEGNDAPVGKTQRAGITRLVLVNLIFFAVVAGGLMLVSGHSLFDFMGLSFWAAKNKDNNDGSNY